MFLWKNDKTINVVNSFLYSHKSCIKNFLILFINNFPKGIH